MSVPKNAPELIRLAREASRQAIDHATKGKLVQEKRILHDLPVLSHWMSLALIASPQIKIIFKAHFSTDVAQALCARNLSIDLPEVFEDRALDFMKEYCNLSTGFIRRVLMGIEVDARISLPLLTRGFDDLFFPNHRNKNSIRDSWILELDNLEFAVSVFIEVLQDFSVDQLDDSMAKTFSDNGDVEFF